MMTRSPGGCLAPVAKTVDGDKKRGAVKKPRESSPKRLITMIKEKSLRGNLLAMKLFP